MSEPLKAEMLKLVLYNNWQSTQSLIEGERRRRIEEIILKEKLVLKIVQFLYTFTVMIIVQVQYY
jgi:hypothetical protein